MRMRRAGIVVLGVLIVLLSGRLPAGSAPADAVPSHVPACPGPAAAGTARCHALRRTDVHGLRANAVPFGYGAVDLLSAYNLTAASGSQGVGQTVAVVDAFDDPN